MSNKKILIISGILLSLLISGCFEPGESTTGTDTKNFSNDSKEIKETEFSKILFMDGFNEGKLNNNWVITRKGDFNESTIDVYDYRLRMRAKTIATADDTVKFHGVRSTQELNFSNGLNISFDIDWNNQSNGCYLTASIYLCPTTTNGNPREEKDWLKFEYVGVPPGKNARCVIATKVNGRMKHSYTEGWPENRTGRHIGNQHIEIILDDKNLKIIENGRYIYNSSANDLTFTSAYLYLQMSSHSNYPSREIYFDNVVVEEI